MQRDAKIRLSVMMFLQYAIWGAWAPILFLHLGALEDFTRPGANTAGLITIVYMTMAIASMVAPVAGQLADRTFATQYFLAFSHLVAGALIFWLYYLQTFWPIFFVLLLHCFLYAPTVGLTNSISLANLSNSERDFGVVRLWGTIGWIVISWIFSVWLGLADGLIEFMNPSWREGLVRFRESLPAEYKPQVGHCLLVAGVLSLMLSLFCLTLPHTPPTKSSTNPFAFLASFKLMKKPSFAVMMVVAFLVSTELQFYYVLTPGFFNQGGGPYGEKELAAGLMEGRYHKDAERSARKLLPVVNTAAAPVLHRLLGNEAKGESELRSVVRQAAAAAQVAARAEQSTLTEKQLADAIVENVYKPRAEQEAKEFIRRGDKNGDAKLSNDELRDLKDPLAEIVLAHYAQLRASKGGLALPQAWVGPVMTLGQIAEVLILLLVPLSLKFLGFRWTIGIGILAWSVRYFVFALGEPRELVIGSQLLHGFGFGFFFVGAFLYADQVATPDIRASVQSFIIFVTYGAGMVVSSLIAGPVVQWLDKDWHQIFLVPACVTAFCTVVFVLFFRDPKESKPS